MGISIKATVDLSDVDKGFAAIKRSARDLDAVFREFKPRIKAEIASHFTSKSGPSAAWPKWSPGYLRRVRQQIGTGNARGRAARSKKLLTRMGNVLGRLRSAFTVRTGPLYLLAASYARWGGIHEYGGKARYTIPARPFMWAAERTVEDLQSRIGLRLTMRW